MRILVTAIGSFSGEAVIQSLRKNRMIDYIIGTNMYPASWITTSQLVDKFFLVPSAHEQPLFSDTLLDICRQESVHFIIPLTDIEIDFLKQRKKDFLEIGTVICMSSHDALTICRDKWHVFKKFENEPTIKLIPTYLLQEINMEEWKWPVVLKPRCGRSSEGIFIINNATELKLKKELLQNYIMQPFMEGYIYVTDLVRNHKTEKYVCIARKELLRTKSGAGMSVEIVYEPKLEYMTKLIGDTLGINGCINIEYIYHEGEFYLMDINPRFSAGTAFSVLAGYDVVKSHLACFTDRDIDAQPPFRSMTISRKMTEIVTFDAVS